MTNSSTSSSLEQEKEYGTVKQPPLPSSRQPSQPSLILTSSTCNICLEGFRVDDVVAHASSQLLCRHVFHEDCIVSWLATRTEDPKALCPCCRQVFTVVHGGAPPATFSPFCAQTSSASGGTQGDNETCSVTDIATTVISTELTLPQRQGSRRCVVDDDCDTDEPPDGVGMRCLSGSLEGNDADKEEEKSDRRTRIEQNRALSDQDCVLVQCCTLDSDGFDSDDPGSHEDLEAGNPNHGIMLKVSDESM